MRVARKRTRMKRTQISLLPEQFDKAMRMARMRGDSLSGVVRNLLDRAPETGAEFDDPLSDIIGMVEDADPDGSVKVDEMVYGPDPHR
jgi:hypothetical protein